MQKNLNDIIPPSRRRALGEDIPSYTSSGDLSTPPTPPPQAPRPLYERPTPPRRKFPIVTAIGALVVVLGAVGFLFAFSGSEVKVTAAENTASVMGEFVASQGTGDLPFEIVTVEKVASVSVPSEGTENVNQPAQGTVTIENKQDVPQQLIKNTRFETPDGLIFRIRDSVTVPAARNGAPGTLDTTVYADAAGESYNVGPTTFTLPGLAGSATFTQVTARSAAAMAGGFAGPRPSVGQGTRDAKSNELRAELQATMDEALKEAVDAMPGDYVLLTGADRVSYESAPDKAGAGNNVELSEKAIGTAVVFPREALARSVALQVVGSYNGQPVTFKDAAGLTLTPVGDLPQPGVSEFAFSLSGSATILWKVEAARIAGAVAGKSRDSAKLLLTGFPEVEAAELITRPFWDTTFTEDPAKIKVTVENGQEAQ